MKGGRTKEEEEPKKKKKKNEAWSINPEERGRTPYWQQHRGACKIL
jgi:hypothetical protein